MVKLSFLFVFILISCFNNSDKKVKNIDLNKKYTKLEYDSRLIGKWIVSGIRRGESYILCNACPSIEFFESNYAILVTPSGDSIRYEWNVNDESNFIKLSGKKSSSKLLPYAKYQLNIDEEEDVYKLTLTYSKVFGSLLSRPKSILN